MDTTTLWCFVVTIFGLILIGVLLYKNKKPSTWFLAFFLFIHTYGSLVLFLFRSRYLLEVPFLYRTGWFWHYISAPALLFYMRYLFNEQRPLRWKDALHLIPAVIFLADLMPFFLLSNEHKREVLYAIFQNESLSALFREGWLGNGAHIILKHGIALGYVVYIVMMVRNKKKTLGVSKLFKNIELRQWLWLVLTYFTLYTIFGIITYFISYSQYSYWTILWGNSIIFLSCAITLLFMPSILYGLNIVALKNKFNRTSSFDRLGDQFREGIRSCLEKKLFLMQNVKLERIADEMDVQSHLLSAFINHTYGMRFTDFTNWFRILHVKELLTKPENHRLTLEAIGEEAGFSNRTSFLTAFKKFTGQTPTAYLNQQRAGHGGEDSEAEHSVFKSIDKDKNYLKSIQELTALISKSDSPATSVTKKEKDIEKK